MDISGVSQLINDKMTALISVQLFTCDYLATNFYPIWPGQRIINPNWIKELKTQQYAFIQKYGRPIFPGSIIMIKYSDAYYIGDGQHRVQLIKELYDEGVNLKICDILLEIHDCASDYELAQSVYNMANSRYTVHAVITPTTNVNIQEAAKKVATNIRDRFPLQVGKNAPYFDPNILLREIIASNIMNNKTPEMVINLIINENNKYLEDMRSKKDIRYYNCESGFYLPFKAPKCRWIQNIH